MDMQHSAHHHAHQHDKHAGRSPEMFRHRFWLALVLTIPILYFDSHLQGWFGYGALTFPGVGWLQPILSIILYGYGGWPFLVGAVRELRERQPGMMTLIALAISVAFIYSLVVTFGVIEGMALYWELATLILIMVLGHWIEMASVQGASKALEHLASLIPSTAHRRPGHAKPDPTPRRRGAGLQKPFPELSGSRCRLAHVYRGGSRHTHLPGLAPPRL
jgi:Cu2+-exporting ATPase